MDTQTDREGFITPNDAIMSQPRLSTHERLLTSRHTVKKLPRELRRITIRYASIPNRFNRTWYRLKYDSQYLRSIVQYMFILLCVWIGLEFYLFMKWGQSGGTAPFISRSPGVEGFLPISSLISLKYWLQTGIVNDIHPSGFFILIAILTIGFSLRKHSAVGYVR